MPISSRVDTARRVVFTTASGTLTAEENRACRGRTLSNPLFDKRYSQLIDFRAVRAIALEYETILDFGRHNLFATTSRQAIVATADLAFGIARIFQAHREDGGDVRVFRDMDEARRWLGLEAEEGAATA